MTTEQFEKYTKINNEIKPIKEFLEWCGKKYKDFRIGNYRFGISLFLKRAFSAEKENRYEIPLELQDRIIETIENYVDEKEKELQEI